VRQVGEIVSYHAHIYYHPETRAVAERVREQVGSLYSVQLGRWHDAPVGPHARSMYQIAFDVAVFPELVPWLMLNRSGLAVLVHPNTDSPRDDHLVHALWLGEVLPINAEKLPTSLAATGASHDPVVPNTRPHR